MTFEDRVFKVGDLVRFARRADKYTGPIHWTGNDANGELVRRFLVQWYTLPTWGDRLSFHAPHYSTRVDDLIASQSPQVAHGIGGVQEVFSAPGHKPRTTTLPLRLSRDEESAPTHNTLFQHPAALLRVVGCARVKWIPLPECQPLCK